MCSHNIILFIRIFNRLQVLWILNIMNGTFKNLGNLLVNILYFVLKNDKFSNIIINIERWKEVYNHVHTQRRH